MADWEGEYLHGPSEMMQTRDMLKHYGLCFHSVHATEDGKRAAWRDGRRIFRNRYRFNEFRKDYTSANEYLRLAGVDPLKNRIDLCSCIDATVMVLHMQLPYMMFETRPVKKDRHYQRAIRFFTEIERYAKATGVKIALENLICTPPPENHQAEQFTLLFDTFDGVFLGYAYDSGLMSLMCREITIGHRRSSATG